MVCFQVHRSQGVHKAARIQMIRTVGITLGVYYMCWIPYLAYQIWGIIISDDPPEIFLFIAIYTLCANSAMSGLIYAHNMCSFRKALFSIFMSDFELNKRRRAVTDTS